MTDQAIGRPVEMEAVPPIRWANLGWVALALVVLIAAIQSQQHWFLNFVHVMSGVLWTGIDLFLGFVLGPIMRSMPLPARRAVICRLVPRTMFLMPTLAILTGTAGWYLVKQGGYLDIGYPQFWWIAAALVIITILTVEGLFILMPTNILAYLELRKPNPDGAKVGRLMRRYIVFTTMQGCMQIAIIVVMARIVTGL